MIEETPGSTPPAWTAGDALLLDFDGTLVEIAPRPDAVTVPLGLTDLLASLQERLQGALAIITGRLFSDIDVMLAPLSLSGVGLHGVEFRVPDAADDGMRPLAVAKQLGRELRSRFGNDPRVLVEDKGAAIALHYRLAPERALDCINTMHLLVDRSTMEIVSGKMVIEARPHGANKGKALKKLMTHPLFRGRRPVFVGDDVTDEDGFRHAAMLGGHGIKVGSGATAAPYRCTGVGAVHAWLKSGLERTEGA